MRSHVAACALAAMALCLVVRIDAAAAAALRGEDRVPVNGIDFDISVVKGGEHPDISVDGFTLHEVILTGFHHDAAAGKATHVVQRRQLQFNDNSHLLSRRYLASFSTLDASSVMTKDKVITLAKLNVLTYPGAEANNGVDYGYLETYLSDAVAAGDLIWGGSSYANDRTGMQGVWDAAQAELNTAMASASATAQYSYNSAAHAELEYGVTALVFKRGTQHVICFRGSYTAGDFTNAEKWIADYIIERTGTSMKNTWTSAPLNLAWGTEQADRESQGDVLFRTTIRLGAFLNETPFLDGASKLVTSMNGQRIGNMSSTATVSLTVSQADKFGYWPITKVIMEAMREGLTAGDQLLISGHSQGGGRAQLASMYLTKKYPTETAWPTVTFAAVGMQCAAQNLFGTDANYLADVDPSASHTNIVDYAHPLDVWGSHLGPDVGKTCYYGTTDLVNTNEYKYCSKIWGYSGATLVYANSGTTDSVKTSSQLTLQREFKECRYFTHLMEAMVVRLQATGSLNADGTTDGGCFTNAQIPIGDTDTCPTGKWSADEIAAALGALAIVLIVVGAVIFLVVLTIIAFVKCCRRKCCGKKQVVAKTSQAVDVA